EATGSNNAEAKPRQPSALQAETPRTPGDSISLAETTSSLRSSPNGGTATQHGLETYNAGHSGPCVTSTILNHLYTPNRLASPTNSFCHDAGHPTHDTATEPSGSSAAPSGSQDVPTNGHWSSDRSADAVDDRQDRHYSQMTNGGYVSGENNNAGAHDHNSYVHALLLSSDTPDLVEGERISPDHFGSSTGALGPPEHQHPGGEIWLTALQSTTEDQHRDAAVAAGDDLSSSGPSREYIAGSGTRIVLPLEFFPYLRTGHPMTNTGTKYFPRGTTLALRSLRAKVRIRFRFRGTIY
ncbi:hypothetical protein B0H14DRAFT_2726304, partial [Mycena olivaceomarginata]